eukprot:TRINITY_DN922_c0_g1_i1.p1 TRINITY_DN922_c0_g1~~TRINITY_DN922_c0_g1_i1.p1  ORF type:complete len:243 (+),score=42.23 TRINITY_DN922_c0_g1_i1:197-925(+)
MAASVSMTVCSSGTVLSRLHSRVIGLAACRLSNLSMKNTRGLLSTSYRTKRTAKISLSVQAVATPAVKKEVFERKLYVGNIPRTCKDEELARIFGEFGTVENAEVIYDKYTQKSRRFAFVTMSTVEEAQAAIEKLNGSEIGGRTIKVNITEKPLDLSGLELQTDEPFIDSPHKVYVGNLAKTVTPETLKKTFAEKVDVLSAKVVCRPETGKLLGYGFVSFHQNQMSRLPSPHSTIRSCKENL